MCASEEKILQVPVPVETDLRAGHLPHPPVLSLPGGNPLLSRKTWLVGRIESFTCGKGEKEEAGNREKRGRGEWGQEKGLLTRTDVSCPYNSGFFPSSKFLRDLFLF